MKRSIAVLGFFLFTLLLIVPAVGALPFILYVDDEVFEVISDAYQPGTPNSYWKCTMATTQLYVTRCYQTQNTSVQYYFRDGAGEGTEYFDVTSLPSGYSVKCKLNGEGAGTTTAYYNLR